MNSANIESTQKWYKDKLSAQVRARLLFSREIEIDGSQPTSAFNEATLEGLITQRSEYEQQRTTMLRAIVALTFLMFFVSNGQSMTIPYFQIDLASIPGLNALIGFTCSFTILMVALVGVNIGAYGGLIDQFSIKHSNNTAIDPEILSASLAPHQLALKILRVRFNTYHPVHITPEGLGTFVYGFAMFSIIAAIFGTGLLIYLYTIFFLIQHVPNNYFGIGAKSLSLFFLFSAAVVSVAANWSFSQRIYLVNPTEIESLKADEKAAKKRPKK